MLINIEETTVHQEQTYFWIEKYLKHYYSQPKLSSNLNLTLFISYTFLILNELFSGYIRNILFGKITSVIFEKQLLLN
jgi:hypothetical protein